MDQVASESKKVTAMANANVNANVKPWVWAVQTTGSVLYHFNYTLLLIFIDTSHQIEIIQNYNWIFGTDFHTCIEILFCATINKT